jgi:hypothetical protein
MNAERRTQCGLKGSLCQGDNEQPLFTATTTMNDTDRRFQFFDGRTGLWELGVGVEYPQEVTCPVGGMVVFHYPVVNNNNNNNNNVSQRLLLPSMHDPRID